MNRLTQLTALCLTACAPLTLQAAESSNCSIAVVSVRLCFEKSQEGQKARTSLESLNKQAGSSFQEIDRQLEEISNKLNDEDLRDSLTQEAEKELQDRFDTLSQDRELKRMQYNQQISQTQMHITQELFDKVDRASKKIALDKGFSIVLHDDATFYFAPKIDITQQVIEIMDKEFEEAEKAAKEAAKKQESKK